ncbi:MAG: hypothetical protein JXB49_14475 [Bacteroidales bacterium]|nr:hypothetical protein [Bacteroidales bacterium]
MKNIHVNNLKILLDHYLIGWKNDSMYNFCFRYIHKNYSCFNICQIHKIAQILAKNEYNPERELSSVDGLPLNMDWLCFSRKIINIYHNLKQLREKEPGTLVIGMSNHTACNYCKEHIDCKIFIVADNAPKLITKKKTNLLFQSKILHLMEKCENEFCRCSFLVFNPGYMYIKDREMKFVQNLSEENERLDFVRKTPFIFKRLIQMGRESENKLAEIRKNRQRSKH